MPTLTDDDHYSPNDPGIGYHTQIGDSETPSSVEALRRFVGSKDRPTAPSTAPEAVAEARALARSGVRKYPRLCLQHVREDWDLPPVEPSAQAAWNHAQIKHPFKGDPKVWEDRVPFGAPVFSTNGDATGHVFIAGGYFQRGEAKGRRIFRSNDVRTLGAINAVTLDFFIERWGHRILGWTHDLNGFWLPLKDA